MCWIWNLKQILLYIVRIFLDKINKSGHAYIPPLRLTHFSVFWLLMGLTHLSYSSMLMILFSGLQEMPQVVSMDLVVSQLSADSTLATELDSWAFQDLKLLQFWIFTTLQMLMCLACGCLEWIRIQLLSQGHLVCLSIIITMKNWPQPQ